MEADFRSGLQRRINNMNKTQNQYIISPDEYVFSWERHVKGKVRKFVSYKGCTEGKSLRYLHTFIDLYLKSLYTPNESSYAYKKKSNIITCLNRHLNSTVFLKSDIFHFFDSVDSVILKEKIGHYLSDDQREILSYLDCCFYDNKMPIGFITSPVLSDFYLYELDNYFSQIGDIVYTRYADDFIISTSVENAELRLEQIKNDLVDHLKDVKLDINHKKTYIRRLKEPGDSIHLLGLNIVKTTGLSNRITVSDCYLREISKEYCDLVELKEGRTPSEITPLFAITFGKIQFVVSASENSANKLKKMISIKLGYPINLDHDCLLRLLK